MSSNQKNKSSLKDTSTRLLQRATRRFTPRAPAFITPALVTTVLTIIGVILLFPYASHVQMSDLPVEGEVAKETIIAPFTFDVMKSRNALEKERREAMEQVLLILDFDSDIQARVRRQFLDLRTSLRTINNENAAQDERDNARASLRRELTQNTIQTLLERPYLLDDALFQAEKALENGILSVLLVPSTQKLIELRDQYNAPFDRYLIYDKNYATLQRDSVEITVNVNDIPVKEIALENISHTLRVERMFDQDALASVYEVMYAYLAPNVTVDGMTTARRRQQASQQVLAIKGKIIKDTEIVRKHQEVTPEILEKLRSLRHALQSRNRGGEVQRIFSSNIGKVLLVIIPILFLIYYVREFYPGILKRPRHMSALATIVLLQIAIIRAALLIVPKLFEGASELTAIVPEFIVPTAIGSMLATIVFNMNLGFVITLYISIYFGVALGFDHSMFIFSLLGGLMASFSSRGIRYRWDFFKAMAPLALVYGAFICIWHLIGYRLAPMEIIQNLGLGVLNCILTTFFAMMSVAIFENVFDITTDMTLVELSDMNHPLLKRLSIEAPGTYNHSVLVANLAESAAERINAHPLLTRVASYYHDIGKIVKPSYFVENQKFDKNIHNKLSPNMSALIICSHVKEGQELARKYKLPTVIQNAILQHHGTSTVSFFYEKALEQDPHKQVQEKDFRYPGPRPQTREDGIIMLADSVEAASRSLATSSPKLLRELVKKIIQDKFASSQLDECDLTFRDLDEIVRGFMPVLQGIFHTRVEYPNKK